MIQGRFFLFQMFLLRKPISLQSRQIPLRKADSLLARQYSEEQEISSEVWHRLLEYRLYKSGEDRTDLNTDQSYVGHVQALIPKLRDRLMQAIRFNLQVFIYLKLRSFHRDIAFLQAAINLFCHPR